MLLKKGDKRGANILTENIIFLVLNLIFLTIVVLFVFSKSGSAALLEEQYAKQIALTIDSAKARMSIDLDLEKGIKKAEKEGQTVENMISITGNLVTVKINPKGKGYSYSFFSDVDVSIKYVGDTFYRIEVKNG